MTIHLITRYTTITLNINSEMKIQALLTLSLLLLLFHRWILNGVRFVGSCTDPGTPTNGRRIGTFTVGSTVQYECSSGYELYGTTSITCGNSGQWNASVSTCSQGLLMLMYSHDYSSVIFHSQKLFQSSFEGNQ